MGPPPGPRFQWPLDEVRVTSGFGRRFHPIAHRNKMHSGIDIAAERNQPVMAAGQGIVVRAGWMQGYGYEVTVDHGNGRMTRYSHLARTLVLEGTQVVKGMPLGLAGRTGTATGVHLHFEYWKDDVARDPLRDFARLVGDEGPKPVVLAPSRSQKRPDRRRPQAGGSGRLIARGLLQVALGALLCAGAPDAGTVGEVFVDASAPPGGDGSRAPSLPHAGRGVRPRASPARRRRLSGVACCSRTGSSSAARRSSSPRPPTAPASGRGGGCGWRASRSRAVPPAWSSSPGGRCSSRSA